MSSNATQLWELLERSGCPAAPLSGEWTDLRAVAKARALSQVVPLLGKLARRMPAGRRSTNKAWALGRFSRKPVGTQNPRYRRTLGKIEHGGPLGRDATISAKFAGKTSSWGSAGDSSPCLLSIIASSMALCIHAIQAISHIYIEREREREK
jgi:hypothetical protein